MTRTIFGAAASAALIAVMSTGCANRPAGADILLDKQGYLDKNFQVANVKGSVRESIAKGGTSAAKFRSLKLITTLDIEREGQQPTVQKSVYSIRDLGDGYIQVLMDASKNDLPVSTKFLISYRGVVQLRSKWASPSAAPSGLINEVKSLSAPIALPAAGSKFTVETTYGNEIQLTGFSTEQISCTSGDWLPAQDLHAKLPGRYLVLSCEESFKGTTINRMKLHWLEDLGMAYQAELTNVRTKEKVRLDEVQIER